MQHRAGEGLSPSGLQEADGSKSGAHEKGLSSVLIIHVVIV